MDGFGKATLTLISGWIVGALGVLTTIVIVVSTILNQDWSVPFAEQDWGNLWWAAVSFGATIVVTGICYATAFFNLTKDDSNW